jgi:hypothetical protein
MRRDGLRDERGVATVMVVLCLPFVLLALVFAVDAANWFVHKRHLQNQADAAALAGAGAYRFPDCADDPIVNSALRYSGKGDATATYNPPGDVATDQARLHAVVNGPNYFNQSKPNEADLAGSPGPCASKMVDVKMTETDLPWFWGTGIVPNINAQARVQLFKDTEAEQLLPIGVQEAAPRKVRAYVVDEATGTAISGASAILAAHGNTGDMANFDNEGSPLTFAVPAGTSALGVRVALSGSTSTTCGDALVSCYDSVTTTHGLSYIRTWSDQPDPLAATATPVARSVVLSPVSCPNASFNSVTAACTFNVIAKIKWNPGVTAANLAPATSKTKLKATYDGVTKDMTYSVANANWTTATPFTAQRGAIGTRTVDLAWEQQVGKVASDTCTTSGGNKCKGSIAGVQRTFWNDPKIQTSAGGPIAKLDVLDSATVQQVSDLQRCSTTHTTCNASLTIQLGVRGSLSLAAIGDPAVSLRVDENQSQSLECDPTEGGSSGLENTIALGCKPTYTINSGHTCGSKNAETAAANPPAKWPCVVIRAGTPPNSTPRGLNRRILCNPNFGQTGNCTANGSATTCTHPNHWPNFADDDPRKVGVFLTPFGTFTGSGTETVPVIGFAAFYITGYTGEGGVKTPCDAVTGANKDEYSINPPPKGNISGHYFIDLSPNLGGAGTDKCDFTTVSLCTAVLVK